MIFLIWGLLPAALFCALVPLLSCLTTQMKTPLAHGLVPTVSGMICVTAYMAICVRQMSERGQESQIMWVLGLTMLVSGIVQMLWLHIAGQQCTCASLLRKLRFRSAVALLLLITQCLLCCAVWLSFVRVESMNALLLVGLFCVNHLLFLFPLAGVLLALVPAEKRCAK